MSFIKFIKLCSLFLLLLILISLSACGRRSPGPGGAGITRREQAPFIPVPEVLTVLAHESHYDWFRLAESRMAETWREARRGDFILELTMYSMDIENALDTFDYFMSLETMLMEGYNIDYDMLMFPPFNRTWWDVRLMGQAGVLADIFNLIDWCRYRGHDDYFTGAFNMFTFGERLYGFPLNFYFEYIAINSKLPERFIDRFKSFDYVNSEQLMKIYFELMEYYPYEFGHLAFVNSKPSSNLRDLNTLIWHRTTGFVDLAAGTSNLQDEGFINYLEYVRRLFPRRWDTALYVSAFGGLMSQHDMSVRAEQFVFLLASDGSAAINAFLPHEYPYFVHFIPLSNECGELMARSNFIFCFPEAGNSTLAWEFMQYLQTALIELFGFPGGIGAWLLTGFSIPIAQDLFGTHFENWFSSRDAVFQFSGVRYRIDENMDDILARLYMYSQMPAAPLPLISEFIVSWTTESLFNGTQTAEETARLLHYNMVFMLSE